MILYKPLEAKQTIAAQEACAASKKNIKEESSGMSEQVPSWVT